MRALLKRIGWKEFLEWQVYHSIDPFGNRRGDLRAASICAMIANVNRDTRRRAKPFQVSDFVLTFGEDPYVGRPRQTWQQQKAIAQIYAAAFNAAPTPRKRAKKS